MPINYDKNGNYIPTPLYTDTDSLKGYQKKWFWAKLSNKVPKVYISRFKSIEDGGEEVLESRPMTEPEYIRYLVTKEREKRTGIRENNYDEDEGIV